MKKKILACTKGQKPVYQYISWDTVRVNDLLRDSRLQLFICPSSMHCFSIRGLRTHWEYRSKPSVGPFQEAATEG